MKKILQINCVLNSGSTGKIMAEIENYLMGKDIECIICYGRGKRIKRNNLYKISMEIYSKICNLITRVTGIRYGSCYLSTWYLQTIIKRQRPDIVHLHCINCYFVNIPKLIRWLNKNRIPTVLTLHAEFMFTANCSHAYECEQWKSGCEKCEDMQRATRSLFFNTAGKAWQKMKWAYEGFEKECHIVSVSPWGMSRAKESPFFKNFNHYVIMNGVNINIFKKSDEFNIRNKHNIGKQKMILHVTAHFSDIDTNNKGGFYIWEMAKRMPDMIFVVVGEFKINHIEIPKNIIFVGKINNQKLLAEYYSSADVTLITSKRETFSMVVAESLCCGTPVAGFLAGGPESIAIEDYVEFVDFGNTKQLEKAINNIIMKDFDRSIISKKAIKKYGAAEMARKYDMLYQQICAEKNNRRDRK